MDERASPSDRPRLLGWIEGVLSLVAAAMLMAIMSLTFLDVIGRYVLARPIPGSYELVALAMGILVFAGVPIITLRQEHLTIGLFENALAGAVKPMVRTFIDLVGLAILALYAWRVWVQAGFIARTGEVMATTGISVAPFAYFMSAMAALSALLTVLIIVRRFTR
jgi:TRAP-type C4-dicarboxylate transport system permease small subunit